MACPGTAKSPSGIIAASRAPRGTGAWPSGKAPGFGPGIAGSNPAAPAAGPWRLARPAVGSLSAPLSQGDTLSPIFAVVLAGGKGTRMKSNRAKVPHTLCGVPMVNYVIEAIRPLVPERLLVVVGHQAGLVEEVLPEDAEAVLQKEQLGTGDAVRVALGALEGEREGVLLVVNGDGPLISDWTLNELVERHRSAGVGEIGRAHV